MPTLTFMLGSDGKLPVGIKESLARLIPTYANKKCRITIEEAKEKRSTQANSFYWGVIIPTVRSFRLEQGEACSVDDIHEDLLATFAPLAKRIGLDGSVKMLPMRSSAMNKDEFTKYILAIEVALADFGISLPAHPRFDI